ncbi:MAG: HD domain-containing protein [Oscillospiraceae bacterium]|nr:HD domain-containing protein [Oscillospiraceae bacterium]
MSKYYAKKDIYSKDGRLLLASGQEISEKTLIRLKSLDCAEAIEIVLQKEKSIYEKDIEESTRIIEQNLNSKGINYYKTASSIAAEILYESKNQPWWIYINTLSNYVNWMYLHAINVSIMSIMMAKVLKLDTLNEIALGAFLHDIGKMMIPKSVIQKPNKLTDVEMMYIKQHCELGVSMLKDHNLNQIIIDIISQHHEKQDGSGYPQGLKGAEIPVHSKIVTVADAIDAITSYRPYKLKKSLKTAIEELRQDTAKYPQDIIDAMSSLLL